jgi:hypothetical protein
MTRPAKTPHGTERLRGFTRLLKKRGRVIECVVQGSSMGDTLREGSRIRLQFSSAPPTTGQVVAAVRDDMVVTHRIVHAAGRGRGRGFLLMRGDASLIPDAPVALDEVIGPVSEVEEDGRWVPVGFSCRYNRLERAFSFSVTGLVAALMAIDVRFAGMVSRGIQACARPFKPDQAPARTVEGFKFAEGDGADTSGISSVGSSRTNLVH